MLLNFLCKVAYISVVEEFSHPRVEKYCFKTEKRLTTYFLYSEGMVDVCC